MASRKRLDRELVRRGLAADEAEAASLVAQQRVTVNGAVAATPTRMVEAAEALHVQPLPSRFVGRGGEKLEAALARWNIDVARARAIDVGASTGGFTDCLLQRGAASVVALDVGRAQLHQRLRSDERVVNLERTNVKEVDCEAIGAPFDVVVADLSFMSVTTVASILVGDLAGNGTPVIVLVKPQFEATHTEASAGKGVIADPGIWRRTLEEVLSAMEACGAATMAAMASPIRGGEGNVEFLVLFRAHSDVPGADRQQLLECVLGETGQLS